MNCIIADCNLPATIHIARFASGALTSEQELCAAHAQGPFDTLRSRVAPVREEVLGREIAFDVDAVVIFREHDSHGLYLRESNGSLRFSLAVGMFEATAILQAGKSTVTPRPMTHQAMASIIDALAGELGRIVIDEFDVHKFFHARIHMRQSAKSITIDMRPSDAVALALVSNAPIFISGTVLLAVQS